MRACIRLLFDRKQADPLNDETVAKVLKCHRNTVGNVRHRFVVADVAAALYEKPLQPQAAKKRTGEVEAHLIALTVAPRRQGGSAKRPGSWPLSGTQAGRRISHMAVGERRKKTRFNHGK